MVNDMAIRPIWMALALASTTLASASIAPAAGAATPLLIWPVDPVIEPDRSAAALWLENRGREPALMQVRIYRWSQPDGADRFDDQEQVEASPPIVEIAAGSRQMVRLTVPREQRQSGESAYRVIIDEVPLPQAETASGNAVRFQMRYSIPLFVHGAIAGGPDETPAAQLRCSLARWAPGGGEIRLTNGGSKHARLLNLRFETGKSTVPLGEGLLGYALPGSTITRKLPPGVTGHEPLFMQDAKGAAVPIAGCSES